MVDMARKQVLEVLLLVLAALAVTVEFVGFISPGWLCLSVKYQNQSDGSDVSRWADDFDMTHWANKFEKNLADAFDDSGTDDRKRVRRQEARTSLTSAGERLHNATANNTSNWKGRPELPFKIFNSTQEEEVYKHFQQWVKNKNINNLSLPSNVTAFKKWLYSSNGQYLVLKKYFGEFSRNGSRAAPERFYFPVIESWLRGGADAEGQQDFKLPKFPDRTVTDVPGYKQAAIYKEFKSYVAPTIRAKLPNNYKYFITWMSQNMTRIQQMKVRYLYFMQDIDESKVDLYEHVIESWFIQALPHSATDGDQWADSLVALPMLSGMEWTVRLGIWYGKECVIIPGSTEDQCDNTNAVQLEQNGLEMKPSVISARHFQVVIVLMAVVSILFEVVGFASSGWLVVGKAGLRFGNVGLSGESGLSAKNSTNNEMESGMPNRGLVKDTDDNPRESDIPKPEETSNMLSFDTGSKSMIKRPKKPVTRLRSRPMPENPENSIPDRSNGILKSDNGDASTSKENVNVIPGVKPARPDMVFPGRPFPNKILPEKPSIQQPIDNGGKPIPEESVNNKPGKPDTGKNINTRPGVRPSKPDTVLPGRPIPNKILPEKPSSQQPNDNGGKPIPEERVNEKPGKPDIGENITTRLVRPAKPDMMLPAKPVHPLLEKTDPSSEKDPLPGSVGQRILTQRPLADPSKTRHPYLKNKPPPSAPVTEQQVLDDKTVAERTTMPTRKTNFAGRGTGRQGHPLSGETYWNIQIGLWTSRACSDDISGSKECSQHSVRDGLLLVQALTKRTLVADVGGMATWNDLRVETIIGLCACVIGLVGTLLTVKPFCLKGRQRVTTIVGICGMVLSCILFLVPIVRIAGIHSTLQHSYMFYHDELHVQMPWAAAVSGIGACLALVSAGCLAFFTWADERQKWNKFDDDPSIVFKNDVQRDKSTCDMDQKETSNTEGKYDNMATMSDI